MLGVQKVLGFVSCVLGVQPIGKVKGRVILEGEGMMAEQQQRTKEKEIRRKRETLKDGRRAPYKMRPGACLAASGPPSFLCVSGYRRPRRGTGPAMSIPPPHPKEGWITEPQRVCLCPTLEAGERLCGGPPSLHQHQDEKARWAGGISPGLGIRILAKG